MRDYYCTLFVSHDRVATVDELCLSNYARDVSFIWFMGAILHSESSHKDRFTQCAAYANLGSSITIHHYNNGSTNLIYFQLQNVLKFYSMTA